jgi:hypothetical protein
MQKIAEWGHFIYDLILINFKFAVPVSNNFDPGVWWPRIDEKGIEMEMDMS